LILVGGSDMVVGHLARKGGQYCHYGLMLSRSLVIIQDGRPEIGNTSFTLISQMRQRACCLAVHIAMQPISRLSIAVTIQLSDCRKDQTKIGHAPLTLR
jgi:hypothetical protein